MIVTSNASEFNREPSKILETGKRGIATVVDKHGLPAVPVIPTPKPTSGADALETESSGGRRVAHQGHG